MILNICDEYNNITYTNLILDYRYDAADDPNRFYYRSDHYNFAKHNIPVIFFFNGVHDDYHQPTDTFERADLDFYHKVSETILSALLLLDNADLALLRSKD